VTIRVEHEKFPTRNSNITRRIVQRGSISRCPRRRDSSELVSVRRQRSVELPIELRGDHREHGYSE
jgi:hypothetical protein